MPYTSWPRYRALLTEALAPLQVRDDSGRPVRAPTELVDGLDRTRVHGAGCARPPDL